jgi:hypothetical protein
LCAAARQACGACVVFVKMHDVHMRTWVRVRVRH